MDETTTKLILTGIVAAVCITALVMTKGDTGAGWFILGLFLVWA